MLRIINKKAKIFFAVIVRMVLKEDCFKMFFGIDAASLFVSVVKNQKSYYNQIVKKTDCIFE